MTTKVEKSLQVDVPIGTAYNQWTQFEEFPRFMGGVSEVRQLSDRRLHWVAQIMGVRREWEAEVLEQVPDQKVAWAATSGATNAGAVRFVPVDAGSCVVYLSLEYEPEGAVEHAGDALGVVERQVVSDLERFKQLVESQGHATGAWRGEVDAGAGVGNPGVDDAAASRGDSGKAGLSTAAKAAGAVVAGAAAAGAAAVAKGRSGSEESEAPAATTSTTTTGTTTTGTTTTGTTTTGTTTTGEATELRTATPTEASMPKVTPYIAESGAATDVPPSDAQSQQRNQTVELPDETTSATTGDRTGQEDRRV